MDRKILTSDQRVRIFVSSTLVELKEERARIIKAIKDLKLIPIFFESGAHPYPPKEWYRSNLQQSHIYVGIFDRSYGCVAPSMKISGIEDEHILAKERKLPRFVYVKNTNEDRDKPLEALLERIEKDGDICYKPFDNTNELGELVQNDIAILLSERFGIGEGTQRPQLQSNYLKQVEEDMKRYGYIERSNVISDILKTIETEKRILLLGEPGMGKTFLLGKIGLTVDAIYISLLNKTPLHVFTYLTNHLRMKQNRAPEAFTSEDDAKIEFEISLEDSEAIMLIDHTDQNPALAHTLFSIPFYRNKAVFAARSETILDNYVLPVFQVNSFTRNEIEQYLEFKRTQLGISEFTKLLRASRGNPLYLFYFTNFQIEPLPEGLEGYQKALWRTLSTFDQELLGIISLSLFPPSLEVISQVVSRLSNRMSSGMEIANALSAISSLLQVYEGHYKIFHPYFKEYIIHELKVLGLAKSYHLVLGEVNQKDNNFVNTAFHFIRADDKRADDYLLEASQNAFLWGLWDLTEEFLIRYLEINSASKDVWNQGYAHYQLCWFYRERGKLQKAKYHYEKALDAFENCGDNDWFWLTKIWQYLDWISEGNGKAAVESLEKLLEKYEGIDNLKEAQVLVNLSFAYIQLSQAEKGANAAKRAYEIFAKYGDYNGLTMSLTNLTSCLGQLEEYKLVKEYAEKMIILARNHHHQRFLAAGLNHLALAQRKLSDPDGAQKSLEEAIEICQNLGAVESEIMNILNLGNIHRDKNDYERSIQIYQDAFVKAKTCDFKREEGRALELIASIKRLQKDFNSTIELSTKAINIQEELGNSLRIAEALIERAYAYENVGELRKAAEDFQAAGRHYNSVFHTEDAIRSYSRAASLWANPGDEVQSLNALRLAVNCSIDENDLLSAQSSIDDLQKAKRVEGLGQIYLDIFKLFVQNAKKYKFAMSLIAFATYCKLSEKSETRKCFWDGLKLLSQNMHLSKNICNALAIGIEQADERLMGEERLTNLIEILSDKFEGLYFRIMPDGLLIITVSWRLERPIIIQIQCLGDRLMEKRLSLALALILWANQEEFKKAITENNPFLEDNLILFITDQDEFEEKVMRLKKGEMRDLTPAIVTSSNVPFGSDQPPTGVIIHSNYKHLTDWSINPSNKAFVWVLMNIHRAIVGHFSHKSDCNDKASAKKAREFCEEIFGFRETELAEFEDSSKRWEVEDILSLLKYRKGK